MFPINLGIAPLKVISIFYNSVLVALCPLITSVIRQIGKMPTASILFEPIAVTGNIFTIRAQSIKEELYLLGIINSILINFFWEIIFADFKTSFPQVTIFSLSQIPIREINFKDKAKINSKNIMVNLVEQILNLNKQLSETKLPQSKTTLKRQIEATDREIDRLVYELYDLTDEEIKIVEESFKK